MARFTRFPTVLPQIRAGLLQRADVVVLGSGIAGAAMACELANHGMNVVVLDPHPTAHTSNRGAGQYSERYVEPALRELMRASPIAYESLAIAFSILLRDPAVSGEGLMSVGGTSLPRHPLMTPKPSVWLGRDQRGIDEISREMDREPGDFRWVSEREALRYCPLLVPGSFERAAIDYDDRVIDNFAVLSTYLAIAQKDPRIQLVRAEAYELRRLRSGWEVRFGLPLTERGHEKMFPTGRVHCAKVINAAGAWAPQLTRLAGLPMPDLVARQRSYFHVPCAPHVPPTHGGLVIDGGDGWYFRQEGRLIRASPSDDHDWAGGSPLRDTTQADLHAVARTVEAMSTVLGSNMIAPSRDDLVGDAGVRSWCPDDLAAVGEYLGTDFYTVTGLGGAGFMAGPGAAQQLARVVAGKTVDPAVAAALEALSPVRFDDGHRPTVRRPGPPVLLEQLKRWDEVVRPPAGKGDGATRRRWGRFGRR